MLAIALAALSLACFLATNWVLSLAFHLPQTAAGDRTRATLTKVAAVTALFATVFALAFIAVGLLALLS